MLFITKVPEDLFDELSTTIGIRGSGEVEFKRDASYGLPTRARAIRIMNPRLDGMMLLSTDFFKQTGRRSAIFSFFPYILENEPEMWQGALFRIGAYVTPVEFKDNEFQQELTVKIGDPSSGLSILRTDRLSTLWLFVKSCIERAEQMGAGYSRTITKELA